MCPLTGIFRNQLIMECCAISQIYSFINVLFIAASALYHIDYMLDLQKK